MDIKEFGNSLDEVLENELYGLLDAETIKKANYMSMLDTGDCPIRGDNVGFKEFLSPALQEFASLMFDSEKCDERDQSRQDFGRAIGDLLDPIDFFARAFNQGNQVSKFTGANRGEAI
jgi:hypothetical protein